MSGMFDAATLPKLDHISGTKLCLEWLICHMMYQQCSMLWHCVNSITLVQRNSFQNDSFLIWYGRDVRWEKIVQMVSHLWNKTLIARIDLSLDGSEMLDHNPLCTFDQISWTELFFESSICYMMCQGCSMVKLCLVPIKFLQRNSAKNDWHTLWAVSDVR